MFAAMPNFDETVKLVNKLLTDFKLEDWEFIWFDSKRSCGKCWPKQKRIGLSITYVTRNKMEDIENTIRHEIAHALTWKMFKEKGHTNNFYAMCVAVGAKPQRLNTTADMPQESYKYQAACRCDVLHKRKRAPHYNKYYRCSKCGHILDWRKI